MSKWIEFANHILKKKDVDFFGSDGLIITCHFHQGQDYRILTEEFGQQEDKEARFYELQYLLGIHINESIRPNPEIRRAQKSEAERLGILATLRDY